MKKITFLIGFIIMVVQNYAQVVFEKRFALPGRAMKYTQQDSAGQFMFAGGAHIYFSSISGSGCHASKMDANGNIIWGKKYNNLALLNDNIGGSAFCRMSDGGMLVVGSASNDDSTTIGNILLMRLDASGAVVWSEAIGDSVAQYSHHGASIIRTMDGNYVITVMTFYITGRPDYIAKVTDTGTILWQKLLADADNIHLCAYISATADGGFIACGRNMCLLRFDSNGNIVFRSIPTMPLSMGIQGYGKGTLITADSSFLVTGTVFNTVTGGATQSTQEFAVAKYSYNGALLWYRKYKNQQDDWACSAVELDNGDFLIAGSMANSITGVTTYPGLVRIDSLGNFISAQRGPYGGEFQSMLRTPDNGIILGGMARNSIQSTSLRGLVVKIDSTLNIPCFNTATATDSIFTLAHTLNGPSVTPVSNNIIKSITVSVVDSFNVSDYCPGLSVEEMNDAVFDLFPNPTTDVVTIQCKQDIDFPLTVTFYTMQGEKVLSAHVSRKNNFDLNVSGLKAGIYVVDFNSKDFRARKKLVLF